MAGKVNLSQKDTYLLWGRAAGRCEFEGCNKILYRDNFSLRSLNLAERAHIVARSPNGPRGDLDCSRSLVDNIDNVMLLCRECHDRIDSDSSSFPAVVLKEMKNKHEKRIEFLTGFDNEKSSHIVTYSANIGDIRVPIDFNSAVMSMIRNGRTPAEPFAIDLSNAGNALKDDSAQFWEVEERNLVTKFNQKLLDRISETGDIRHSSLFAIAPVPLLIKLGSLFTDKCPVDIYQKKREPSTWDRGCRDLKTKFHISVPECKFDTVALVLSLSADINTEDVYKTLGKNISVWHVRAETPNYDCIVTLEELGLFRNIMRETLNKIKKCHGADNVIHTFAAIPISAAIEVGRVWMPRADLPMQTYNRLPNRNFQKALLIGKENIR